MPSAARRYGTHRERAGHKIDQVYQSVTFAIDEHWEEREWARGIGVDDSHKRENEKQAPAPTLMPDLDLRDLEAVPSKVGIFAAGPRDTRRRLPAAQMRPVLGVWESASI